MKNLFLCIIFLSLYAVYSNCHTTLSRVPIYLRQTRSGCFLPPHPQFGKWVVWNSTSQGLPGKIVPSGTILEVSCNKNFTLDGLEFINCKDSSWHNTIGRCLRKCPPIYNTEFLKVRCLDEDRNDIDCTRATENSRAEFSCQDLYEVEDSSSPTTCVDGKWKNLIHKCLPECGKNRFTDSTFVVNTSMVRQEDYPWQVAIYNSTSKKELICSGSLLSERVILTAAHCISDNDGNYYSKDNYVIAVGKYYRRYDDNRDFEKTLFSRVHSMYYPKYYHGQNQNFYGDIAIIITERRFMLSERVRPVCIERRSEMEEYNFKDPTGYVAGWGFTHEDGNFSDELQLLKVPLVNHQQCFEELPKRFKRFLTDDKVCAGYLNKGISVCKGDSGGGLIFKRYNRYYIYGLVSVGPSSPRFTMDQTSCDSQHYTIYTKVSEYSRFIQEKIALAEKLPLTFVSDENTKLFLFPNTTIPNSSCMLPDHPKFGQWSIIANLNNDYLSVPGQSVESRTRLKVNCEGGYLINSSNYLICEDGSWNATIGSCLKTCPPLHSTQTLKVQCVNTSSLFNESCVNAIDGTLAKFECRDFYEDVAFNMNLIHICVKSRWNHKTPVCSPECGKLTYDTEKKSFFPWHVAIYTNNRDLICSGSLISEKVILTAAHCVKDAFLLAVGNHYRSFNDSRDSDHIQISEVDHVSLPESRVSGMYYGDLAILIAKEIFKLSARVRPICINKNSISRKNVDIQYLYTSGWGYNIDKSEYPDILKTTKISENALTSCDEKSMRRNNFSDPNTICVKYVDNGLIICYGDTGAGLVFQHDDGRFYLSGVMSFSPNSSISKGVCNRQEFGVYLNINNKQTNFILRKEAQFRPSYDKALY